MQSFDACRLAEERKDSHQRKNLMVIAGFFAPPSISLLQSRGAFVHSWFFFLPWLVKVFFFVFIFDLVELLVDFGFRNLYHLSVSFC